MMVLTHIYISEIDAGGGDDVNLGQETPDLLPPVQDLKELIERDGETTSIFVKI